MNPMTFRDAKTEAHRRWGTSGTLPGDRSGSASRGRHSPLYRLSYYVRGPSGWLRRMGESDVSWEDAFAKSDAEPPPGKAPFEIGRDPSVNFWGERPRPLADYVELDAPKARTP